MHCGILEEQNRKGLESVRSEMQQERSKAQALQHKVLELKTVRRLATTIHNITIVN